MTMLLTDARHLVARTGLGVVWHEVSELQKLTRDQAIGQRLSAPSSTTPSPPSFHDWRELARLRKAGGESRRRAGKLIRLDRRALQRWLCGHLLTTDNPLHDRLTLFWHNHFTSSLIKVPVHLMLQQHMMLRSHAMGHLDQLLGAVAIDPAMLIYLDGVRNRRGRINENFAREFLELFTLGEGHYSESDVISVARAFTGWRLNYDNGEVHFEPQHRDNTTVQFLGHSGSLSATNIIDIVLEHPATARTIVVKFWREFICDSTPDPDCWDDWAARFRRSDYDIGSLLKHMLKSDEFWGGENRGALTKSPVDIVIGACRELRLVDTDPNILAHWCRRLGQDLLTPPTVRGWQGGSDWIDTQTLLTRHLFLRRLISARELTSSDRLEMTSLPSPLPDMATWEAWLLPLASGRLEVPLSANGAEQYLTSIMLDPRYQVR